jgi:hypothetical protein
LPFPHRSQQSRISPRRSHLVRAGHTRSCQSTHLPRGTGKNGGRRPPRANRQPLPALCSIALRNIGTRVCREHD